MERCDFGSIMTIIRRYISEDKGMNQIDFTYLLFDTFMCSDEAIEAIKSVLHRESEDTG